jgi:hypothetical protein
MQNSLKIENLKEHEKTYNTIIGFYDFAERLVDSVEYPDIIDKVSYLDFIEAAVENLETATDVLSEEYRNFVATGKRVGFLAKMKIEKALDSIIFTFENCKKYLENRVKSESFLLYCELQELVAEGEKKIFEEVIPAFIQLTQYLKLSSVSLLSNQKVKYLN